MRHGWVTAVAIAVLAFVTSAASADVPAVDQAARERAAARFEEGVRSFSAGDFRSAAESFERAYALAPHHDALWNAGQAWQKAGEIVKAANHFERFLAEAPVE